MKVFKSKKSKEKKQYFELEIEDDKYIISFECKKNTFVYDVSLECGKKIIIGIRRKVNQNSVDYHEKMNIFIEAL